MRGTVTDEEGKPVPGADVRTAMQNSWSPMAAVTGKDGKYELADVPAGPIAYFRIDCDGYMPYPDPSAPPPAGESLREGAVMVRDVVLRRGLAAELHVVGSDTNAAIEGCEVTLYVVQPVGRRVQPWKRDDRQGGRREGLGPRAGQLPRGAEGAGLRAGGPASLVHEPPPEPRRDARGVAAQRRRRRRRGEAASTS